MGVLETGKTVEYGKWVTGLAPITPSTSTPDYVSLKNYTKFTAVILCDNATTVTGSAITLKQATAVAGTGETVLGFDYQWANADTGASDTLVKTAVTSDTFTTATTANKNLMYVIEVDADTLDAANSYDCIRVGTADAVATTVSVAYYLWGSKYSKGTPPAAITD